MKFPKIRGGGVQVVWNFFKKTSIFWETVAPYVQIIYHTNNYRFPPSISAYSSKEELLFSLNPPVLFNSRSGPVSSVSEVLFMLSL